MRIFLTGMMGCGKSFWGNKIAEIHHLDFIDLDEYIEQKLGCRISEIFKNEGERYFRDKESFYLKEIIMTYPHCIVATGGGTPCFHLNMQLMKESGIVVYLKTDLSMLAHRIFNNTPSRPLAASSTIEELMKVLENIYSERRKIYEQSERIIDMNQIDEAKFAENFIDEYV